MCVCVCVNMLPSARRINNGDEYKLWILCWDLLSYMVYFVHVVCFSSSGYLTPVSDHRVLTPSMSNSPFTDAQGQSVSLYSHQPSSTVQWMPRASAAEHSAGWLYSSQLSQVTNVFFLHVLYVFICRKAVHTLSILSKCISFDRHLFWPIYLLVASAFVCHWNLFFLCTKPFLQHTSCYDSLYILFGTAKLLIDSSLFDVSVFVLYRSTGIKQCHIKTCF